jgi:hypothetical protein
MQKIPFRKRILYYVLLLATTLGAIHFFAILTILISGHRETGMILRLILAFLIAHYILGVLFLKTKWIIKLIVPLVTAIVSFGGLLSFWKIGLFDIIKSDILLYFIVFILLASVWEIAYQILIKSLNKKKNSKLDANI